MKTRPDTRLAAVACLVLSLSLGFATGCKSTTQSTSDWDHAVDFSGYHTFDFQLGMPFQSKDAEKWVTEMVEYDLIGKGYVLAEQGEEPDLHIFLFPRVDYAGRVDWYTTGYTSWWGGWGGTVGVSSRFTDIPIGGLMVDIVDNETDRLVWRGTANTELKENQVRTAKKVLNVITTMMKGFPPPVTP